MQHYLAFFLSFPIDTQANSWHYLPQVLSFISITLRTCMLILHTWCEWVLRESGSSDYDQPLASQFLEKSPQLLLGFWPSSPGNWCSPFSVSCSGKKVRANLKILRLLSPWDSDLKDFLACRWLVSMQGIFPFPFLLGRRQLTFGPPQGGCLRKN